MRAKTATRQAKTDKSRKFLYMGGQILATPNDFFVNSLQLINDAEDSFELRAIDVAAAHHADDLFTCKPTAQLLRRRKRRGARAFGEIVGGVEGQAYTVGEFGF